MKKVFLIFLVCLILITSLTLFACKKAESEKEEVYTEGLEFVPLNDTECAVSVGKASQKEEIVVPSRYKQYTVTQIGNQPEGEGGFYFCEKLRSITLPNTLKIINKNAFKSCPKLQSVRIKEGSQLTAIEDMAFYDCTDLHLINLPKSLRTIGNRAFFNCYNLVTVNFEEGSQLTSIGLSAFSGCSDFQYITLPKTVTNIERGAFTDCHNLVSITLPQSVTYIGDSAFLGCNNLTIYSEAESKPEGWSEKWNPNNRPVVWKNGVETPDTPIGTEGLEYTVIKDDEVSVSAYTGTASEVIIPPRATVQGKSYKVTAINTDAFIDCANLTAITIPYSVTTIYNYAFRNCSNLGEISIEGAPSIGNYAFTDTAYFTDKNNWEKDVLYLDNCLISAKTSIQTITFKEGTKSISAGAFSNCANLTEVTIPSGIKNIDDYTFFGCTRLTRVNLPNSVTNIGESAFYNCSNLSNVTIPNTLESIGDYAFENCSSITTLAIPDSVTTIGNQAFSGCANLSTLTIGKGVKKIGDHAFRDCANLVSLSIDGNQASIGDFAFFNCTALKSLTLGHGVASIGANAFRNCSTITVLFIPNSVTIIGDFAFDGCDNLTFYCQVQSQPDSWSINWNPDNRPRVWGCSST